jgi:hypothetical protein
LIVGLYAFPMPAIRASRNVRDFIRDLCATTSAVSQSNLITIGQILREAGEISQAGHGVNAASATPLDVAMLLIAITVEPKLKDAVEDVRKYGGLVRFDPDDVPTITEDDDLFVPTGYALRHMLAKALKQCSSKGPRRFSSFRITLSDFKPEARLELADYRIDDSGDTRTGTIKLYFEPNELWGQQPEDKRKIIELDARLLNTAADLLKPNVAAANRAHQDASRNETNLPAPTGRPVPSDETPQAAKPEASTEHLKASETERESQAGFQSLGDPSGGIFSSSQKESLDDDPQNNRPDRLSACVT